MLRHNVYIIWGISDMPRGAMVVDQKTDGVPLGSFFEAANSKNLSSDEAVWNQQKIIHFAAGNLLKSRFVFHGGRLPKIIRHNDPLPLPFTFSPTPSVQEEQEVLLVPGKDATFGLRSHDFAVVEQRSLQISGRRWWCASSLFGTESFKNLLLICLVF